MILAAAFVTAVMTSAPAAKSYQADSACLHVAGQETPEQRDRRVAALGVTRAINSAQATHAAKNNRMYATREELAGYLDGARFNLAENAEIVPGFKLTIDTTPKGYWFETVDKTDACGFRFISNQSGLIFTAQPIR